MNDLEPGTAVSTPARRGFAAISALATPIAEPGGAARAHRAPAEARTAEGAGFGVHRAISLTATLGLLWPLFQGWWSEIVQAPTIGLATVGLTAAALVLACLILAAASEEALERLDRWLLVLALLTIIVACVARLNLSSGYGTDEAAFVHASAATLLHGHDPYGANLLWSLSRFGVEAGTPTMSGGLISTLGYPAFPVLLAVPFVALLGGGQAVAVADVFVLLLVTAGVFFALPSRQRPLAVVLCVCIPALLDLAVSGLVAIPALATLVLVAHRWASIGERGRLTRREWIGALALGIAVSTSQLAWFIAPFLLIGIVQLRRPAFGARRALALAVRYAALAAVTFLALNLPFIVWGPGAWLRAVAAPLVQHAIPYGQGLVGLTVFLRIGGGDLDAYSYAAGALYISLLILYAARFRRLGRACFLLPILALFSSGRSLGEYWLALVPVCAIAALTVPSAALRAAGELRWPRPPRGPRARLLRATAPAALFLPAAALLALALLSPAPLALRVLAAPPDQARTAVTQLRVEVRNRSSVPLRPHFMANSTGQTIGFWRILSGPRTLAAGAEAQYVLAARDSYAFVTQPFVVQALTGSPMTISSSAVVDPRVETPATP
jgi:hypothetical protein